MKYCSHCGAQLVDEAIVCPKCGCSVSSTQRSGVTMEEQNTMYTIAKILAVVSCCTVGLSLIPLIWMIPMTVKIWKYEKTHEPMSETFKILTILFLNVVSGILLLFVKTDE